MSNKKTSKSEGLNLRFMLTVDTQKNVALYHIMNPLSLFFRIRIRLYVILLSTAAAAETRGWDETGSTFDLVKTLLSPIDQYIFWLTGVDFISFLFYIPLSISILLSAEKKRMLTNFSLDIWNLTPRHFFFIQTTRISSWDELIDRIENWEFILELHFSRFATNIQISQPDGNLFLFCISIILREILRWIWNMVNT